jgi:shikimate dehydrogenase
VLRLSLRGFVGANVTSPHKEQALALSKPGRARQGGRRRQHAVVRDGELRSTNTDVEGFINNLDASAPGWDEAERRWCWAPAARPRAVVFGLIERGIKTVHLVNRTLERAQALADQFGAGVHPAAGTRSQDCCRARASW